MTKSARRASSSFQRHVTAGLEAVAASEEAVELAAALTAKEMASPMPSGEDASRERSRSQQTRKLGTTAAYMCVAMAMSIWGVNSKALGCCLMIW